MCVFSDVTETACVCVCVCVFVCVRVSKILSLTHARYSSPFHANALQYYITFENLTYQKTNEWPHELTEKETVDSALSRCKVGCKFEVLGD